MTKVWNETWRKKLDRLKKNEQKYLVRNGKNDTSKWKAANRICKKKYAIRNPHGNILYATDVPRKGEIFFSVGSGRGLHCWMGRIIGIFSPYYFIQWMEFSKKSQGYVLGAHALIHRSSVFFFGSETEILTESNGYFTIIPSVLEIVDKEFGHQKRREYDNPEIVNPGKPGKRKIVKATRRPRRNPATPAPVDDFEEDVPVNPTLSLDDVEDAPRKQEAPVEAYEENPVPSTSQRLPVEVYEGNPVPSTSRLPNPVASDASSSYSEPVNDSMDSDDEEYDNQDKPQVAADANDGTADFDNDWLLPPLPSDFSNSDNSDEELYENPWDGVAP